MQNIIFAKLAIPTPKIDKNRQKLAKKSKSHIINSK